MKCSSRLLTVPASPIRKLVPYAMAAKKTGVSVLHLNIGDPDIKTPDVMTDVLRHWNTNPIGYGQSQGEVPFLAALATYYQGLGYAFVTAPDIQVTNGGSEAISMAMFATCEAGDEILTFEPLYTNYNSYARVNGVTLAAVPTSITDGFHLPARDVITSKITKKTKAILFCNPNNPTGTVYTKDEVEMLVSIAKEYGLFLMSDEVYREYCYDGKTQISLLSYMEEIPELAIVLDSMSKRYSLCGARLGCLVSKNADVMSGVLRIGQGRLSSGSIDQAVAAKLTDVPASYITDVQKEYSTRRDVLYAGLKAIAGVTIPKPEGAFYAIVGLPVDDAEKFAIWLLTDFRLNNETVMVAPAAGFYATPGKGQNEIRIAYVLNCEKLTRAIAIIQAALEVYPGKTK